ncbi:MAG: exosortase A [Pseudomonadota bacterium]
MTAMGANATIQKREHKPLWAAALFVILLLGLYWPTAWSMVEIWSRSDTFAHGFLILPISMWLIWSRREQLLLQTAQPAPVVALLLLPVVLVWLLASLVDVSVVRQLALVSMLVIGVWSIAGHEVARVLMFPLGFLFFAVPMGEALIPPMMEFTATSTVWLIRQTGIPVFREGLYFTLPTGSWSVVEACSGVRYIIASVTVGVLYAYLTYVSWVRRVLFVLVSAIVPIFANTLRAYIIVMLGHMSDMTIATGADHLVYGWVFFGLVIFILFWLGSFFREDIEQSPEAVRQGARVTSEGKPAAGILLLCLVLVTSGPVVAMTLLSETRASSVPQLPLTLATGSDAEQQGVHWRPPSRVSGETSVVYDTGSSDVRVIVQYPTDAGDVIGSSQLFTLEETPWRLLDYRKAAISLDGDSVDIDVAVVSGPTGEYLAWSWYQVGEFKTSNDYWAKLLEASYRLRLAEVMSYRMVLVVLVDQEVKQADTILQAFVESNQLWLAKPLAAMTDQ